MKKLLTFLSLLGFFVVQVVPAYAMVNDLSQTMKPLHDTAINTNTVATGSANTLDHIKARANMELTRRLAALQKLTTRLQDVKRLTADQKSMLISEVQAQITTLTNLQTKIQADTDLQTLQADKQSIIFSYRIFALYIPKMQIIAAGDRMLDLTDKYSSVSSKLQTRLSEAQGKGINVASLQLLVADMQAKIADAKTQAQNAINAVLPLSPDGYPGNKTILQSARQMLDTGHHDQMDAFHDLQGIIQGLRDLLKGGTPSPQASGSATPSPSGV